MGRAAKHNCKHCYGRGYIGNRKGEEKKLVICRCAMKKIMPEMIKRKKEKAEEHARKSREKKGIPEKG